MSRYDLSDSEWRVIELRQARIDCEEVLRMLAEGKGLNQVAKALNIFRMHIARVA